MRVNRDAVLFWAVAFFFVGGFVTFVVVSLIQNDAEGRLCNEVGGVWFDPKGDESICLSPDATIVVPDR